MKSKVIRSRMGIVKSCNTIIRDAQVRLDNAKDPTVKFECFKTIQEYRREAVRHMLISSICGDQVVHI